MTEIDVLKYELEENRKSFDTLHKKYVELLKQQGRLEKENEQLKKELDQFYLLIGRGDWSGLIDKLILHYTRKKRSFKPI